MHKLIEYICDELEDLERKADKEGQLSMQEIEYGDMLAHFKKSLLTADAMMNYDESMEGGSYARGRRGNSSRESRGRSSRESYERGSGRGSYEYSSRERGRSRRGYSQDAEEIVEQLREMEMNAPDEETRKMIRKFIKQAEEID